jgi:RNA polymerase sigma-70 factor (ECF subfamily)
MQKNSQFDEATILSLLADSNEHAFEALFDRYRAKIYRLGLKFLKDPDLAEEVVQDVFLKIWLKRSELGELRSFDSYLFIVARNTTLDSLKKLASKAIAENEFASELGLVDYAIDYSSMDDHYQEMVRKSLALLPMQQARVFQLAKIDGLSHEAIAAEMNISKLTVKKHMANALQLLRQRLYRKLATLIPLIPFIF